MYFKNWIEDNILYVSDLVKDGKLMEIEQIQNMLTDKRNWIVQCNLMYNAVKAALRKHELRILYNVKGHKTYIIWEQKRKYIEDLKSKIFYKILLKGKAKRNNVLNIIGVKYNKTSLKWWVTQTKIFSIIWNLPCTKILQFRYRMVHNKLASRDNLSKWLNNYSELCNHCKVVENCEHLIYQCIKVRGLWERIENTCRIKLEWTDVLLGFYRDVNDFLHCMNIIIPILCYHIYKENNVCKRNNTEMDSEKIWSKFIWNISLLQKFIYEKNYGFLVEKLKNV